MLQGDTDCAALCSKSRSGCTHARARGRTLRNAQHYTPVPPSVSARQLRGGTYNPSTYGHTPDGSEIVRPTELYGALAAVSLASADAQEASSSRERADNDPRAAWLSARRRLSAWRHTARCHFDRHTGLLSGACGRRQLTRAKEDAAQLYQQTCCALPAPHRCPRRQRRKSCPPWLRTTS